MEIIARYVWPHVDRRGPDECWPWTGGRNTSGAGHGVAYVGNARSIAAHRAVYQLMVRPLERHEICDHLCRNPLCVNPAHIEIVTQKVNVQRGRVSETNRARAAAVTHCPKGHEYTEENTRYGKLATGYTVRMCRECGRIQSRAAARRRREAHKADWDNVTIS